MKQYNHKRGITLLELIITIALLSTLVLTVASIDKFSHYHVISSDRRAKLQNEISYTLEHMAKEMSKAVGNRMIQNPINITTIFTGGCSGSGCPAIVAYTDSNYDGQGDLWIAYLFRNSTNPENSQIWYCPNCTDDAVCSNCNTTWGTDPNNIIGRRINTFAPADNSTNNYIDVGITARWQPAEIVSVDNPEITLRTRIKMPSVTTN